MITLRLNYYQFTVRKDGIMTKKLFQEDVYKRECESIITEVRGTGTTEDPFLLVLDQTIFFPTGGGQPCDLGTIGGISLTEVFGEGGEVFHRLLPFQNTGNDPAPTSAWKAGDKASCLLDWDRRFDHMQRHCGEHILSGIFFRECGGVNRGFHMGSGYMTIDIDVPVISREEAQKVETLTNEVIWANVPVTTRYFEDRAEAEKLPLRKALAIDEDISIVCVGEESNPADCVACCGTHPSTSGQVGLLKIMKMESYKGMTRVYFKAGREAFSDYQNKHQILAELHLKYSSEDHDLLEKIKIQDVKNKETRQGLLLLKNTLVAKAADEISGAFNSSDTVPKEKGISFTAPGLLIREYPYFQASDLLSVIKAFADKPLGSKPLIALISTRENVLILTSSGKYDCGKIIKDNAHVWRGKGGGNPSSARVMFPAREDLECFVSFLSQAYQAAQ